MAISDRRPGKHIAVVVVVGVVAGIVVGIVVGIVGIGDGVAVVVGGVGMDSWAVG